MNSILVKGYDCEKCVISIWWKGIYQLKTIFMTVFNNMGNA